MSKRPTRNAPVTLHGIMESSNQTDPTVTVWFRHCTVVSFGEKQAALRDAGSDANLHHRIYPREYGNVASGHALNDGVAQKLVNEKMAWYEQVLAAVDNDPQWAASRYAHGVVDCYRAKLAALREGRYAVCDLTKR